MILLVDDKSENLIALKKTLEARHFQIDTALSGEEALKKLLSQVYELIVMDVQMPGMDGFEVAEAIAGYSKTRDIPIIFLSAVNISKEFITKGYAAGGKDYLVKPFDIDILVLKMETFIKLHMQNKQLQEIQDSLNAEIEKRKQAESKKDEFISIASHELNTPITIMKGYLQLAEKSLDLGSIEQSKTLVSRSAQQIVKLTQLVAELLDTTKIESGGLKFDYKLFDLELFLEKTIERVRFIYPAKRIIKSGTVKMDVYGDEARLEQVLINYLTNAFKYAPESDEVLLSVQALPCREIEIAVKDSGIGIPKEKQSKIFEKYFRVEENSIHFQGLGMGLYICSEIIKAHNGVYGVESEPEQGSTFYFRIPVNFTQPV